MIQNSGRNIREVFGLDYLLASNQPLEMPTATDPSVANFAPSVELAKQALNKEVLLAPPETTAKATRALVKEMPPLRTALKKAIKQAVSRAGEDAVAHADVKMAVKEAVKKAVNEAVTEIVLKEQEKPKK